jgi:phage host-nuclease inhibitor protein Gam
MKRNRHGIIGAYAFLPVPLERKDVVQDIPQLIKDLRWGNVDIKTLTREEIMEITDYYAPDVIALCHEEIKRRRNMNLDHHQGQHPQRL